MRKLFLLIFFTLFGLGIGLVVGAIVVRRLDRATARLRPGRHRSSADRGAWPPRAAPGWRERLQVAREAGAAAAAAKEQELRARFGVPTAAEAAARRDAGRTG